MICARSKQIYLFFSVCLLAIACGDAKKADVSHIPLRVTIERFDQSLSMLTPQNLSAEVPILKNQYGSFYSDYMSEMLSAGSTADTAYYANLRMIITNKDYLELKSEIAKTFPDLRVTEEELTDAFKHIKYYYPQQKVPRLISFFSGFYTQVATGDGYMGIGLDMFLGANSRFYPALRQTIPGYISRRYTKENITPRIMECFIREELFPEQEDGQSLVSRMIYNGRVMYMMDAVLPDVPDSLKISYTSTQQAWCEENEANIWGYFLGENILYETDYMKIQKYLTEAPFTPGVGEHNESAPKLAIWTGWQIVRKYMKRNPEISLQQLMQEKDFQRILTGSKYKP